MRKGEFTKLFEPELRAEDLARKFYLRLGYKVADTASQNYMRDSRHPTEMACYEMALDAIEMFMKDTGTRSMERQDDRSSPSTPQKPSGGGHP